MDRLASRSGDAVAARDVAAAFVCTLARNTFKRDGEKVIDIPVGDVDGPSSDERKPIMLTCTPLSKVGSPAYCTLRALRVVLVVVRHIKNAFNGATSA